MTPTLKIVPVLLVLAVMMAGCKTTPVGENEYNDPRYNGPGAGTMSGDQGGMVLFGTGKSSSGKTEGGGAGLGVNAYLWRAALDTLSFMPLASADPFGGVIITDWYQPQAATGERFKATAYVLGRQLRADGIRVSLFRQVQENGQWVDAPVANTVAADLENKVLARARELRAQSAGG
jgi:hypothetical protein